MFKKGKYKNMGQKIFFGLVSMKNSFRLFNRSAKLSMLLLISVLCSFTQTGMAQDEGAIEVLQLRDHIYLIAGDGAHIVVLTGPDGKLVIDTGAGEKSEQIIAAINKLGPEPIYFVLNTSAHPEHTGGNISIASAGQPISVGFGGPTPADELFVSGATIIGHANVLGNMLDRDPQNWPEDSYLVAKRIMRLNGEGIEIEHIPNAYSDADSIVMFRNSDIIVTGEVIDFNAFPQIDIAAGGSIQGVLAALNKLVWDTISELPLAWREGGTIVVPARGRLLHRDDVVQYRDMVTIIHDRIQTLIDQGMSLDEVIAANPTLGYRTRYGNDEPGSNWTSDMFVEAIYTSLTNGN
jgi:glyoxylase-like metal-dependent hydrolase (beta-lactamase superfamily II)